LTILLRPVAPRARRIADRQRGLGAGVDHAHHLAGRHQLGDGLGHGHFGRARRAERQPIADGLLHGLAYGRVIVADDHWAPGADVVDIGIAIHVMQVGAIGALHEERFAADRLERTHR